MLLVSGTFNIIGGLAAVSTAQGYAGNVVLIPKTSTAWGGTWLIYGLLEVLAGAGILTRRAWSRGWCWSGLNAIGHRIFISAYPFWSVLIIVLAVVVIYVLTVYGEQYAKPRR